MVSWQHDPETFGSYQIVSSKVSYPIVVSRFLFNWVCSDKRLFWNTLTIAVLFIKCIQDYSFAYLVNYLTFGHS